MPIAKEDKILIKNLLALKSYYAKQLVKRVSQPRLERRQCVQVATTATCYWLSEPSSQHTQHLHSW